MAFSTSARTESTAVETDSLTSGYERPAPLYEGHVPLSTTERILLAAGSAFMSLWNPWRAGILLLYGS
jgi:ubiquinone biosynthesis protein Coq4